MKKLFAIAPCWKLSLYISLNSSFNKELLALSVEIVQLQGLMRMFMIFFPCFWNLCFYYTILQNITYNARLITLLYLLNNNYDTYNVGYSC